MEKILLLGYYNPSMISKSTDSYNLYFYDNFVIAEAKENIVVDSAVTESALRVVLDHFKGEAFTIISHRKNAYTISEEAYSPRIFKKVRGLAVVSADPQVKERAFQEQLLFRNSFVFFEELNDAINWAQTLK